MKPTWITVDGGTAERIAGLARMVYRPTAELARDRLAETLEVRHPLAQLGDLLAERLTLGVNAPAELALLVTQAPESGGVSRSGGGAKRG